MKNLKWSAFLCVILISACAAQTQSDLEWKRFDFPDSGIKVELPCSDPSNKVGVFQEEPRLARRYSYGCEKDGFDVSVSLAEHFGEFDSSKVKASFDGIEEMLREGIGDNGNVTARDFVFQNYAAREIVAKNENVSGKLLLVQNERGTYSVQIRLTKRSNQSKEAFEAEFEKNAKLFFDSFAISGGKL